MSRAAGLLPVALMIGCHSAPVAHKATGAVVSAPAPSVPPTSSKSWPSVPPASDRSWPSTSAVKTDSGRIAIANLEGELQSYTKLLASPHQRAFALSSLVTVLGQRAQFLGLVEGYDQALVDAEELVKLQPKDPKAHLIRAHARSSLHLFQEALGDLDQALKLAPKLADEIGTQRAGILQAIGRTDEAVQVYRRNAEAEPNISTLGALALGVADQGKIEEADALLARAPLDYFQGNPVPVAWLTFQRGMLWERQGQPAKAIGYYKEATNRLPQYAVAQAHLAGLLAAEGQRDQGISILRDVTKAATDPEFIGQLGGLLEEAGQKDEAAKDKAAATTGFEALLAKHPEAFADHAARFYLGPGANPKRALELAQLNLKGRQSPDAFDLGLTAALEAEEAVTACDMGKKAGATLPELPTPHLKFLVQKAAAGCGVTSRGSAPGTPESP